MAEWLGKTVANDLKIMRAEGTARKIMNRLVQDKQILQAKFEGNLSQGQGGFKGVFFKL